MPVIENRLIGKFKKHLIQREELNRESKVLCDVLNFLKESFYSNYLPKKQILALFVLVFHVQRIFNHPFYFKKYELNNISFEYTFPKEILNFNNIFSNHKGIIEFISIFALRYMPESIRETLLNILTEKIDIIIIDFIPSNKDMLIAQSEGKRYITLDFKSALNAEFIEDKRDAFEFVLHDLEHAYCFFNIKNNPNEQIQFYNRINIVYYQFEILFTEDPIFEKEFSYLVSDMNSHPEHLKSYIKAILINHLLRKSNKKSDELLSSKDLVYLDNILSEII